MSTPAHDEVRDSLLSIIRTVRLRLERNTRALKKMRDAAARLADTLAVREALSAIRYHQRIERERQIARDYLRDLVSVTEQELGLRPEFAPERKKR